MVDANEDWGEDGDGATTARAGGSIPGEVALAGIGLGLAGALPLTVGGRSFFDVAWELLNTVGWAAVPMLLMVGAPFLLGLLIGAAGLAPGSQLLFLGISALVSLIQADLVYLALHLIGAEGPVAPYALIGFAAVTSVAMILGSAELRARGDGRRPPLRWWIRWGALLVAGLALWIRLQSLQGAPIGLAIDGALLSSVLIIAALRRG
ncbi:MAG: hypothetical protein KC486_19175 [Myxococcales bacterium]|nr:hypothetical protein [Myxococcales bacterium]